MKHFSRPACRTLAVAAAATLTLLVGACGSTSTPTAASSPPPTTSAASTAAASSAAAGGASSSAPISAGATPSGRIPASAAVSSTALDSAAIGSTSAAAYPVTITTCGQKVTFDRAPTRAVSNDINTFEDMVALGLEPSMVGTFGLSGYGPGGATDVPTQYAAPFKQVKQISPDYITLEPLVGLKPDFLFAGWNYGLKVGSTLTPDNLTKYGIKTLVLSESCAHVQASKQAVSINDTYADLTDLGQIFGVQAKAAALINSMKAQIGGVQKDLAGATGKKVFLYDSGTDAPFTAPGLAEPDALIALAGGVNIFHNLKQTWTSVSWEQVIVADPDCIIINDYGTPAYTQKKTFLQTSPITKNLRAVKAGCFVQLTYGQLTPSPLNGDTVAAIAKALYPDKVK